MNETIFRKSKKWWNCLAPIIGTFVILLSCILFIAANVVIKLLDRIDTFNITAYRFLGIWLPVLPIIIYKRLNIFPKGSQFLFYNRDIFFFYFQIRVQNMDTCKIPARRNLCADILQWSETYAFG